MDTKNTTTMIIGLAVAVILVAGMMIPVISSLGNNSGSGETYTNTGDIYFASGNHTLSVTAENTGTEIAVTVTTDGTTVNEERFTGASIPRTYPSHALAWGDDWVLVYDFTYADLFGSSTWTFGLRMVSSDPDKMMQYQNTTIPSNGTVGCELESANGTLTISYRGDDTSMTGFKGMKAAQGDSVIATAPYVMSDTAFIGFNTEDFNGFTVFGTIDSVTPMVEGDATVTTTPEGSAYLIDSITVTGVEGVEDDIPITQYIVPVQIGGGTDSGVSDTLMSVISIIPLITVVGIVIGAIGFIRMKD